MYIGIEPATQASYLPEPFRSRLMQEAREKAFRPHYQIEASFTSSISYRKPILKINHVTVGLREEGEYLKDYLNSQDFESHE